MEVKLEVTYVKFINIDEEEDFDEAVDEAFDEMPMTGGNYRDWDLSSCDWEVL